METIPEFEYDRAKSDANVEKHGIDFEQAQELWRDEDAIIGHPDTLPKRANY